MKSQEWENLEEDLDSVNINEVIDLLRQALETTDMLFVERALNLLEGYDTQLNQGYDQFVNEE